MFLGSYMNHKLVFDNASFIGEIQTFKTLINAFRKFHCGLHLCAYELRGKLEFTNGSGKQN